MPFEDVHTHRQLKLAAFVAGVAIIAFLQQLLKLFTATGGNLFSFGDETVSFISVSVLFLTVFYLLLKQYKTMQAQLRLAFVDELTGLPNRREFHRLLDEQWKQDKKRKGGWAVFYLDLDKFKSINDSYGHDVGDAVIKVFGERISSVVRKSDTVARLSGDEFAIIMRNSENKDDISRKANEILRVMLQPIRFEDKKIVVGTSIGVCLASKSIESSTLLLSFADFALLQAKKNGRNTFEIFNPGMASEIETRGVLAAELRNSIQAGNLPVVYQPLYSKGSERPRGVEALVRWTHSKYGVISPAVFVPIAEEVGLVDDLTWLVLCKACSDIAPLDGISLSVNVSSIHFVQPGIVKGVQQILRDTGLEPNRLELEINESVFTANRERAIRTIEELREIGVKVALDDFGTGYTTMSYLRDVPVSRIKIDKSFLSDFDTSETSKEVVTSMIKLGRALGLNVTVGGVESSQQLDFLSRSDCTEMQGFHLSKPMTLEELCTSAVKNEDNQSLPTDAQQSLKSA